MAGVRIAVIYPPVIKGRRGASQHNAWVGNCPDLTMPLKLISSYYFHLEIDTSRVKNMDIFYQFDT